MGITTSFLLGFFSIAAIAVAASVVSRRRTRRHQIGLIAAQEFARGHAETSSADYFGKQVGLAYREAVAAASTQESP